MLGDRDIRPALRTYLRAPGDVLIEEMGVCGGQVRVDLAVVGDTLDGYEIKSDRDSLRRLAGQVDLYGRVFERMTMVVGPRHFEAVLRTVPASWGLLLVDEALDLSPVRQARLNEAVDSRYLVELLWLEECMALLEAHGAARGVRGKPRRDVWGRVCERLTTKDVAAAVRDALRRRGAGSPGDEHEQARTRQRKR